MCSLNNPSTGECHLPRLAEDFHDPVLHASKPLLPLGLVREGLPAHAIKECIPLPLLEASAHRRNALDAQRRGELRLDVSRQTYECAGKAAVEGPSGKGGHASHLH